MFGAFGSLFVRPFIQPQAYSKHWGAVGMGVAGIVMQALGEDAGVSREAIQGFITVVTAIAVNLLANK